MNIKSTRSHTNGRRGVTHARIDGRSRNKRNTISALAGRANKTASQRELRWGEKCRFVLDQATIQGHDVRRMPADQIYAMLSTVVCEDHLADPDTVYVFDNYFGVFGDGTRLAMSNTRLRAGLIVIEAWFRGY